MNEQYYQEIDLLELFKKIIGKWWLILLLMIIAGGTSYYYTKNKVIPMYKASATLFIGKESSTFSDLSLNDLYLENSLVVDYRELIKTRLITEEVIKQLGLVSTPEELVGNMEVSTIDESRFMHVSFVDPVPQRAVDIANKISEILAIKAIEIVGVKNIQIVDYAILPRGPISPSMSKNVAIAAIMGMMLAIGLIFLEMILINNIEKEADIEKELGLPVIGVIPHFKGENRR